MWLACRTDPIKVPEAGLREYAIMSDSEDEDTPEVEETQTNLIDDSDDDEPERLKKLKEEACNKVSQG